ncbi:MAG: response regulator [Pseudomonadota bacterium]
MRILYIEDNRADLMLLHTLLAEADMTGEIELEHALSVADGKVACRTIEYDAILLDLGLSDMDQHDYHTILPELSQNFPVLVLTGLDNMTMADEMLGCGIQDYIVKGSLSAIALIRTIKLCISRFRLSAELTEKRAALAASRANFLNLVDDISDPVLLVDNDGLLLHSNASSEAVFESVSEIADIVSSKYDLEECLTCSHPECRRFELELERAGFLRTTTFEVIASPTKWNDKDALALTIRDVTARKETEAQLAAARDAAQNASKLKSQFLSNMSHELRTPLNGIIGMSDALLGRGKGQIEKQHIAVIRQSGQTLIDLVDDLLDISRIESGEVRIMQSSCQLSELLDELANIWRPQFEAVQVEFCAEVGDGLDRPIITDGKVLTKIIQNLVANAFKFTSDGVVSIGFHRDPEADDRLLCRVTDTGVAFSPAELDSISKALASGHSQGLTRGIGGAALGLTLSHHMAHLLGGSLRLSPNEDKGTIFEVVLPLRFGHERPVASRSRDVLEGNVTRVLIAEDNPMNQMVFEALLSDRDYELTIVGDGEAAVSAVKSNKFDLVIMDIHMPKMDGIVATQEIRALEGGSDLPIIAVTADAMSGDRERFLEAGLDAYLSKPVQRRAFLAEIDRFLNWPHQRLAV